MSTTSTSAQSTAPVRAVVIPDDGMFACIIDNARIGTSKHKDYFEYHFRRGDIKALAQHKIGEFVYMGADGSVESVVDATKAKKRGGARTAAPTGEKANEPGAKPQSNDADLIAKANAGLAAASKTADAEQTSDDKTSS